MNANRPIVSVEEFVKGLQKLCDEKRSGTLYFVTDENHAGFLCLQSGAIQYIHYHGLKGDNALRSMSSIRGVSQRFDPQQRLTVPGSQLFKVEQVVKIVSGDETVAAQASAAGTSPKIQPVSKLGSEIRESLEQRLVEHIGPMASLICQEVFASTQDYNSAINVLAGRIPSQEKAREFLRDAQELAIEQSPSSNVSESQEQPENTGLTNGVSAGEQVELKNILVEYIGPMADIVCVSVFSTATNLDNAIKQLAVQIPDDKTARQFTDEARKAFMGG